MKLIACNDRDSWLAERRKGIGGSDAPAIMRLLPTDSVFSPYSNPIEVFQEKLGLADPKEEAEYMRWGHLLEPVIRQEFEAKSGMKVTYFGEHAIATSEKTPFLRCSLDGMTEHPEHGRSVIQIKAVHGTRKPAFDEGVPADIACQVQHEMLTVDASHALVVVLFGGQKLEWYSVHADPVFQQEMLHQEEVFWEHVLSGEPPRAANDDEVASLARTLLSVKAGRRVVLTDGEWAARHAERLVILEQQKRNKAWLDSFKNDLIVAAGDAELVDLGVAKYSTKLISKKAAMHKASSFREIRLVKEKGTDLSDGGDE